MRRIILRRDICGGEMIPRGYGLAYYDYAADKAICYPIGINLAVNLFYRLYWRAAKPRIIDRHIETIRSEAYNRGYQAGKKWAEKEAYHKGYDAALVDLMKMVDKDVNPGASQGAEITKIGDNHESNDY